ncbi:MAG TPA: HisA/HisF-related TIM barrel protein [Acidimicrobiales bacterium]|jgi:phosphoribosylformimino-5-aminoimidazole carboxamide ribotide isomerase|nr:HisA/HisF-related TIM barrel protein [Acidimicrobiales bacterium]
MELYPAIDLRDGTAVRLTQGDFDRETQYGDPLELAARYIEGGAPWIHVVDLNAARTGEPHERATLKAIADLGTPVQTGGGLRSEDDVAAVLDLGVTRVVLGTAAIEDPALATRCAQKWPGQVAVGLDYSTQPDGTLEARSHGWLEGSGRSLSDLLAVWEYEPIAAVVATSIARDGMLEGPDLSGLGQLLLTTTLPVVASGGVGRLYDLAVLTGLEAGGRRLAGVIVGKALVEGRFSVEEAVATCAASA